MKSMLNKSNMFTVSKLGAGLAIVLGLSSVALASTGNAIDAKRFTLRQSEMLQAQQTFIVSNTQSGALSQNECIYFAHDLKTLQASAISVASKLSASKDDIAELVRSVSIDENICADLRSN